jgi:hypothetical protein
VTKNRSRPFLLLSVLGIAWELAQVGLEVLTGKPLLKFGLPFTLLWAAVLVQAPWAWGRRWAAMAAVVLGDLGCCWGVILHFQGADWSGVPPWMHDPEKAGPLWVLPYNALVYAGLLVGLGLLWMGMRVIRGRRVGLVVSDVLVASSVALSLWYGGPALSVHCLIGVGVLPLATMLLTLAVTPPLSCAPGRRDVHRRHEQSRQPQRAPLGIG